MTRHLPMETFAVTRAATEMQARVQGAARMMDLCRKHRIGQARIDRMMKRSTVLHGTDGRWWAVVELRESVGRRLGLDPVVINQGILS